MKLNIFGLTILSLLLLSSCGSDKPDDKEDAFDRSEMLSFWADHYIMPAFETYTQKTASLQNAKNNFNSDPSMARMEDLRTAWLDAYLAWQSVAMFDIGKAEEIGFRNYMNIYPTSKQEIDEHVATGSYNLELPSTFDAQGYPALDYLLYGLGDNDEAILNSLSDQNHLNYLSNLVDRIHDLGVTVNDSWKNGYRDAFVSADGASATASTDKMVNDFLYYYEKFFRAGKIGIPAGVFSGSPIPTAVEGFYSKDKSLQLCLNAFENIQLFFKGSSFGEETTGTSLQQYLEHNQKAQEVNKNTSDDIIAQWNIAEAALKTLDSNFSQQIETNNPAMLQAYDEIQKAVILLKVDMMQLLNIQVDYVDADGD